MMLFLAPCALGRIDRREETEEGRIMRNALLGKTWIVGAALLSILFGLSRAEHSTADVPGDRMHQQRDDGNSGEEAAVPSASAVLQSHVRQSKLTGGVIVALDCGDGPGVADLALGDGFVLHCLFQNDGELDNAREAVKRKGLYGGVSCDEYNGKDLPYVDDLINVLLCPNASQVPKAELMRVLAPGGALLTRGRVGWQTTVKPYSAGMDEWNQFLHGADNNGVSLDNVGPPQRLRWHDAPVYGRSKAISPSVTSMVSAGGVIFTIEDRATTEDVNAPVEYYLVARDAFNGIQLWKRPMHRWDKWQTNSIKSISTQQQRCLAAIGDRVYCCPAFGGAVTVYDAGTGDELRVYEELKGTAEFVIENDVLYAIQGGPFGFQEFGARRVELNALDLTRDRIAWRRTLDSEYTGGTLVVKGKRLVYHDANGLTCLDSKSGEALWTEPIQPNVASQRDRRRGKVSGQTAQPMAASFTHNTHPTIVITDDMVFCGIDTSITAKSIEGGRTLWTAKGQTNYMKSPDLFFADGLVWSRDLKGRHPLTGEVVRQVNQEADGPMSHDRCYRNRITHRYYLNSATGGTDFLSLTGATESPTPWARSTCGLAVMPANGMIYNGPYVCQCAIGTMVAGINGLYNGMGDSENRFTIAMEPELVPGPAFGYQGSAPATEDDWPTYRYSSMRSAVTNADAPRAIKEAWQVSIGSHPTAPVVAGDHVYVAARDDYTLYALDRRSGEPRWTFTAGGRIDSPPTYYKGLILLGSRCGWVYCLRASDGQLVWKFNGMPKRRLICDKGRIESAWPVHGSIMVHGGAAYFAAGRNSFLDGGIGVFGLDPFSGQVEYGRIMQGPYQDDRRSFPITAAGIFQVEGFKADIFSVANDTLFVRNQAFTPGLKPVESSNVKTLHLMASPGFLNDTPQHRTYWSIDRNLRYGPPTASFNAGPAGDILAYDGERFFEVRGYPPGRNMVGRGRNLSPLSTYSIFSGALVDGNTPKSPNGRRGVIPAFGDWEEHWNTPSPFAGHAIAVARSTVLAAGVPMLEGYSQEDTNASYAGERGGVAWLLDRDTGKQLQELRLDAAPTWDGIAVAHNSYFVSLKDGTIVCLSVPSSVLGDMEDDPGEMRKLVDPREKE